MIHHYEPAGVMTAKELLSKERIHNIGQLSGFLVILKLFFFKYRPSI